MRRWIVFVMLLTAMTSCGLPMSGEPHRIDPSTVPYGLLASQPATPSSPEAGPHVAIYLVDGDHLVARSRQITGLNVPAEALRSLLLGPTPAESAQGLISDIPAQTRLFSLDLRGTVATVDLSSTFGAAGGSQQVLAIAQIVYTVTASRYIDAVRFSLSGRPIEVPNGTGSLAPGARSRADFEREAPAGS
ncbi:MAG TPA: GerMN domain-containing protein [Mycobacteriales bacterium]|jgi:spore germination protein GerM|nr:GerMN domain-containing protein [Mycobacteriales bacterium]